ncbi:MAG: ATP-binding protein [Planctomycetes bacterium]|nr:ATP-binding protein [Planctomycetota bacterium]MBI3845075.1 ATP-binding protein [Planctomycetota bacterium]
MADSPAGQSFQFEHTFPADSHVVKQERRYVLAICRLRGMSERKRDELGLAVTEVLNNSIEHGANGVGRIRMHLSIDKDRVVISISDNGKRSLDPAQLSEAVEKGPGKPDDTQFRGRGLFLVHALTDGFRIVDSEGPGTTVELVKLL